MVALETIPCLSVLLKTLSIAEKVDGLRLHLRLGGRRGYKYRIITM